jgi:4-amino-4-deoxy-L-arabinose transferase-like glycosyltransferase
MVRPQVSPTVPDKPASADGASTTSEDMPHPSAPVSRLTGRARALLGRIAQRVATAGRLPWALSLGALALVVRLPLMFDRHPYVAPDGYGYLALGRDIFQGRGFGDPSFAVRPPGYPLFVAGVKVFPGSTEWDVVFAQHLIGVALAVTVLLATWRYFGRTAAIVAGVLAAIAPPLVGVEHEVLSDALFTALVFFGATALAHAASRSPPSVARLAGVGVLFGMATLTKPLGEVLVVTAPVVLIVAQRGWRGPLRGSVVVALGMAVIVLPWVVHNKVEYHRLAVSTIGDEALFWRVFDGPRGSTLRFVGDEPVTRTVRKWYADAAAGKPSGPVGVWAVLAWLHTRYPRGNEAETQLHQMALRAITADPVGYLHTSFSYFQSYATVARPTGPASVPDLVPSYERALASAPGLIKRPVASVSWRVLKGSVWAAAVWWVLSLCGLSSLFLLFAHGPEQRIVAAAFLATWVALGAGTALTGVPELRYSVAGLLPLLVTGSAGFIFVLNALARHAHRSTILGRRAET